MHMADAFLSPTVGLGMWAAAAGLIGVCSRRLKREADDRKVPLMGVLGAFVFAAQMINFAIPGTGSSGHLGGGLLLAVLLGPHAGVLVIASVLLVQALFFADGGLLAFGCNLINLGLFPAFVGYPLFRWIAGPAPGRRRMGVAAVIAAVAGLQLGALAVVLQTTASGISALPFGSFLAFMLPIHLAIGVVEGLVTAVVLGFVFAARPELLARDAAPRGSRRGVLAGFVLAAALTGGLLSWFASSRPDGLEWSVERVTGSAELAAPSTDAHGWFAGLQDRVAVLPDYDLRSNTPVAAESGFGTSLAGLVGGIVTLLVALLAGWLLRARSRRP